MHQPNCGAPTGGFLIFKDELPCLALFEFLFLDVLLYDRFIDSNGTYEISSGPESSGPVLFSKLRHLLKHPDRYSTLDSAYDFAHCILWWNGQEEMNMINRYVSFYYFCPFPFRDPPYPIPYLLPYGTLQDPKSVLRAEYHMVIAKIGGM